MSTADAKDAYRARARSARAALDAQTCIAAAEAVSERLLSLPELRIGRIVLGYLATPEEIDPWPAIEALHGLGKAVALSRITSPGELEIHLFEHGVALESGPFGILQPPASAPRVPETAVDAVIVPGVAFDAAGRRIGYGGGYYDRLLPRLRPDAFRIGIAYDEQLCEELPAEKHDEHMDAVVTPSRVYIAPHRASRPA